MCTSHDNEIPNLNLRIVGRVKGCQTHYSIFTVLKLIFPKKLWLMILQVEELNLPEDKCNEDRNYDFNDCVRKNLSQQVGWIKDHHTRSTKFSIFSGWDLFSISIFSYWSQVGCKTKWVVWSGNDMVMTRALRVLDTRLVLEIFCPTRTRLGPNTTRTE